MPSRQWVNLPRPKPCLYSNGDCATKPALHHDVASPRWDEHHRTQCIRLWYSLTTVSPPRWHPHRYSHRSDGNCAA